MIPGKWSRVIILTGGLGFIGSAFLRMFVPVHPDWLFVNIDDEREGANRDAIGPAVQNAENYVFAKCPLENWHEVLQVFQTYPHVTDVVHFAAESDVDRSIEGPIKAVDSNILGTFNLLEAVRKHAPKARFVQISTDEVYGPIGPTDSPRVETDILNPRNPYAASKASAEHLVQSYVNTYDLNAVITRGCNTFGPWQMPTKLIPRAVKYLVEGKKMPMYGDGQQRREWMPVNTHVEGVFWVWHEGMAGEVYNIGTGFECTNQRVLQLISETLKKNEPTDLHIETVQDRPGHDRRYALDTSKLRGIGWVPDYSDVETAIAATSSWMWDNPNYYGKGN